MVTDWNSKARQLNKKYPQTDPDNLDNINKKWFDKLVNFFIVKLQAILLPTVKSTKHGLRIRLDPEAIPRLIAEQEAIIHNKIFSLVSSKDELMGFANDDEIKERIIFIFNMRGDYENQTNKYSASKITLPVRMHALYEILCTDGLSFDTNQFLTEDEVWNEYEECTRLPGDSRHYAAYAEGEREVTPPGAAPLAVVVPPRHGALVQPSPPIGLAAPGNRPVVLDTIQPPPLEPHHVEQYSSDLKGLRRSKLYDDDDDIHIWRPNTTRRYVWPPLSKDKEAIYDKLMKKSQKRKRSPTPPAQAPAAQAPAAQAPTAQAPPTQATPTPATPTPATPTEAQTATNRRSKKSRRGGSKKAKPGCAKRKTKRQVR